MARTSSRTGRARRRGRRATAPERLVRRVPGTVTVQLLPHLLAAGGLPRAAVGERLEAVPAIYATAVHPGPDTFHGSPAPDHWYDDEFGCVDVRGSLTTVRLDPGGECTCRIEVLDAAGRLAPVNWAATEPAESGRVHLEGALYLDPMLDAGTEHGEAVALCRRRYRVTALRRYRRTGPSPADRPRPLGTMTRVPAPGAVSQDEVYVADLLPEEAPDDLTADPGPPGTPR